MYCQFEVADHFVSYHVNILCLFIVAKHNLEYNPSDRRLPPLCVCPSLTHTVPAQQTGLKTWTFQTFLFPFNIFLDFLHCHGPGIIMKLLWKLVFILIISFFWKVMRNLKIVTPPQSCGVLKAPHTVTPCLRGQQKIEHIQNVTWLEKTFVN